MKTYKREIATLIVIGFGYVVYQGNIPMVETLVWPVFAFAAAAFGLDSYAKQISSNRVSSSE